MTGRVPSRRLLPLAPAFLGALLFLGWLLHDAAPSAGVPSPEDGGAREPLRSETTAVLEYRRAAPAASPAAPAEPLIEPLIERPAEPPAEPAALTHALVRGAAVAVGELPVGLEMVVSSPDGEEVASVEPDGSFGVLVPIDRVKSRAPATLVARVGAFEVGPRFELSAAVRRPAGGSTGTVDVGRVLVGAPLPVTVRVLSPSGGPPALPVEVWLEAAPQTRVFRGWRGAPGEGVNNAGLIRGRRLATIGEGSVAEVTLTDAAAGGTLYTAGPGGIAEHVLGTDGVLAAGDVVTLREEAWHAYELEVVCGGRPLAGARVSVRRSEQGRAALIGLRESLAAPGAAEGWTDEAGRVRVLHAPPSGRVGAWVEHPGTGLHARSGLRPVRDLQRIEVALWKPAGELVRVVDERGNLIPGSRCEINGRPLVAAGDGTHRPPAGWTTPARLWIEASAPGFVERALQRDGARLEDELRVELSRAAPLDVQVVDGEGQVVEGASVKPYDAGGFRARAASHVSDAAGRVRFRAFPAAGEWKLWVEPPEPRAAWRPALRAGGARVDGAVVVVEGGRGELTLQLERVEGPVHPLRVRAVHEATGAVLPVRRLELEPTDWEVIRPPGELVFGNEAVLVEAIAAGDYVAWVETLDGSLGVWPVHVPRRAEELPATLDLLVGEPRALRGRVSVGLPDVPPSHVHLGAMAVGQRLVGGLVRPESMHVDLAWAACDESGGFLLEVAPGAYEIHVLRPVGARYEPAVVDSTAPGDRPLVVSLGGE